MEQNKVRKKLIRLLRPMIIILTFVKPQKIIQLTELCMLRSPVKCPFSCSKNVVNKSPLMLFSRKANSPSYI